MVEDQEEIDSIMIERQSEAEFMNQQVTGDNKSKFTKNEFELILI